jgi:hypothetical protein
MSDTRHQTQKILPNLGSTEDYYTCLGTKGECLPSVDTVVRTSSIGVPSVVIVNIDEGVT